MLPALPPCRNCPHCPPSSRAIANTTRMAGVNATVYMWRMWASAQSRGHLLSALSAAIHPISSNHGTLFCNPTTAHTMPCHTIITFTGTGTLHTSTNRTLDPQESQTLLCRGNNSYRCVGTSVKHATSMGPTGSTCQTLPESATTQGTYPP